MVPILLLVSALAAGLALWRAADAGADRAEMARLRALQPKEPGRFDPASVEALPEPARRFFRYAIAPGTPLRSVAEIEMRGTFRLGTKAAHRDLAMTARQVLAAPEGFVWAMRTVGGAMPLSGSDSGLWTRFWLLGLIPVARFGGTSDHARAAFGRYAAEAVFWCPAAVLPCPAATWAAAGPDTARVTIRRGALEQAIDLTVDAEGRPVEIAFQRWSNANAENTYRLQPFGGRLSGHRDFGGFRLPTRVEAGNMWRTGAYFPFFEVEVTAVTFPDPKA